MNILEEIVQQNRIDKEDLLRLEGELFFEGTNATCKLRKVCGVAVSFYHHCNLWRPGGFGRDGDRGNDYRTVNAVDHGDRCCHGDG